MSTTNQPLTATFIEQKRRELTDLKETLRNSAAAAEHEEGVIKEALVSQPRELEEDAQNLDALEKEGLLVNRSVERVARVDRALAKIAEGTYGYSDVSGEPIPIERLEAVPEAVNTIDEQEASEKGITRSL